MKKQFLIVIFTILISTQVRSQSLVNSSWIAYDSTNATNLYYHFGADTLSYSYDNIYYYPLSTYTQVANTITLIDVSTQFCSLTDTGTYNLVTEADSLQFNVVNDPCTPRSDYLTNYNFVQITTGINSQLSTSGFNAYPNPFNESLSLNFESANTAVLILYDVTMKMVLKTVIEKNERVNTSLLGPGLYYYTLINSGELMASGKIIKE